MKHADTAEAARDALTAIGMKHEEFAALICVGLRTLRSWLAGEKPATPVALMVLRNIAKGWRPDPNA